MKTKQTKIDRSAAMLLPGAMALAATAASSQAATVQITLTGNKISTTGGNQLVADLTGDGIMELEFDGPNTRYSSMLVGVTLADSAGYVSAGKFAFYVVNAGFNYGVGIGTDFEVGGTPRTAMCLNPITFSDSRVNSGALTQAWLEVHAFNTSASDHTVEFTRLIFDDTSTTRPAFDEIPGTQTEWSAVSAVPEASTSLGLLALGAGGLLTRRRLKRAA